MTRSSNWWVESVSTEYRDARDAWEALRESSTIVRCPTTGEYVAAYQLEDADFRAAFPPPTFRGFLESNASSKHRAVA